MKEKLKKYASSIMLDISDEDYEIVIKELESLLVSDFNADLNDYEQFVFPIRNMDYLREDISEKCLDVSDVLKNTSNYYMKQVRVPKVMD